MALQSVGTLKMTWWPIFVFIIFAGRQTNRGRGLKMTYHMVVCFGYVLVDGNIWCLGLHQLNCITLDVKYEKTNTWTFWNDLILSIEKKKRKHNQDAYTPYLNISSAIMWSFPSCASLARQLIEASMSLCTQYFSRHQLLRLLPIAWKRSFGILGGSFGFLGRRFGLLSSDISIERRTCCSWDSMRIETARLSLLMLRISTSNPSRSHPEALSTRTTVFPVPGGPKRCTWVRLLSLRSSTWYGRRVSVDRIKPVSATAWPCVLTTFIGGCVDKSVSLALSGTVMVGISTVVAGPQNLKHRNRPWSVRAESVFYGIR